MPLTDPKMNIQPFKSADRHDLDEGIRSFKPCDTRDIIKS